MRKIKKIFIVCGHRTTGAIANDHTTERELCQRICDEINHPLVEKVGVDINLTIKEKITVINSICKMNVINDSNSIMVEIHCDCVKASGGEMAYYRDGSIKGKELGKAIIKEMPLIDKYVLSDTKSRYKSFGILRKSVPLSVIIECGSLGYDLKHLKNNPKIIGQSLLKGILKHTGVTTGKVSSWAREAVKLAKEKGIENDWTNPQEIVGTKTLSLIFKKFGWSNTVFKEGMTKEQLVTMLWKNGYLK